MSFFVSISWLRFTVPASTIDEILSIIGGEWMKAKKGFQGYTEAWFSTGPCGGLGRIGAKPSWNKEEVHVDLSQEWIAEFPYEKFQRISEFVLRKHGHFGRVDVAFDDREGVIDIPTLHESVKKGQCVSRFKQFRLISGGDMDSGADTGQTLALGSRQSDSYLRIYDKAAQQRASGVEVEGKWVRYEMEWKSDRAHAVAGCLAAVSEEKFQQFVIGVFRSTVDFRDCVHADEDKERCYAPVLSWWKQLTDGFEKAKLVIEGSKKKIEDVKAWIVSAVAPSLAIVCAHPEAGEKWLVNEIIHGVERWRQKHRALFEDQGTARQGRSRLSRWRPVEGFSAALALSVS